MSLKFSIPSMGQPSKNLTGLQRGAGTFANMSNAFLEEESSLLSSDTDVIFRKNPLAQQAPSFETKKCVLVSGRLVIFESTAVGERAQSASVYCNGNDESKVFFYAMKLG